MRKILLNKSRSKTSTNVNNIIPIEINRDVSLFHDEITKDTVDAIEVYNNEKDKSTKHRFIFTMHPTCSNVLFNNITEIIYKEGSDETKILTNTNNGGITNKDAISTQSLNRKQAIRNTEYTNDIFNLNYHYGSDIFNNHLLRKKEDISIQKRLKNDKNCIVHTEEIDNSGNKIDYNIDPFNTIGDFSRTFNGNNITMKYPDNKGNYVYTTDNKTIGVQSVYIYDTIKSFQDAFSEGIKRENGWIGFKNPSTLYIPIKSETENTVKEYNFEHNTPITFMMRIGGNFGAITDGVLGDGFTSGLDKLTDKNAVIHPNQFSPTTIYPPDIINNNNGETGDKKDDENYADLYNAITRPKFRKNAYYVNKCANNKEAGQFIDMTPERDLFYFTPKKNKYRQRLEYNWDYFLTYPAESYYGDENDTILKGKHKGLPLSVFTFIGSDKTSIYYEYISPNGNNMVMFRSPIKHNLSVGDSVILKFSNGENIKCTVTKVGTNENEYKDRYFSVKTADFVDYISENSIPERFSKFVNGYEVDYYYRKFKKFNENFKSTVNKLAFANNIYGDDISQIIFLDDIDIENYRDNLDRPLTEIYLTLLKRNKGYKEWYEYNLFNNKNVEFSHVFGKLTSGFDLPSYSGKNLPNIRQQHNINVEYFNNISIPTSSMFLEEDIDDTWTEFIGDIVEFNPVTLIETVLEEVKYRFNTAQRETNNSLYNTIFYDEIGPDNYDYNKEDKNTTEIFEYKINEGFANISPEGYIYKPHHKIKIGEFSDTVKQLSDTQIEVNSINGSLNGSYTEINFKTSKNYGILPTDIVSIIDKTTFENFRFRVLEYKKQGNEYIGKAISLKEGVINNINKNDFYVFKHNLEIPEYAYMLPDDTGRHLWRDIIKPSAYNFTSDLYKTPFTNGAFYHHVNISLPIRRQDPFNLYNMTIKQDGKTIENNFEIPSIELDIKNDEYVNENYKSPCY